MGETQGDLTRQDTEPEPDVESSEYSSESSGGSQGVAATANSFGEMPPASNAVLRDLDDFLATAEMTLDVIKYQKRAGFFCGEAAAREMAELTRALARIHVTRGRYALDDERRVRADEILEEGDRAQRNRTGEARPAVAGPPARVPRTTAPGTDQETPYDGCGYRKVIRFDRVMTDPIDYLGWRSAYREKLAKAGTVTEEEHLSALRACIFAAVPESEHGYWQIHPTAEKLLEALDEGFGGSVQVADALRRAVDALPDVRNAKWEDVQKCIRGLDRVRSAARQMSEVFENTSAVGIEYEVFTHERLLAFHGKLGQPVITVLNRHTAPFNDTRRMKIAYERWQELFRVLDYEKTDLRFEIMKAVGRQPDSTKRQQPKAPAKQSVKSIQYVKAKDRDPAFCPVCDEKGHSFFEKKCRSSSGKNKRAADILRKLKYCLRCIRPEDSCSKDREKCDGTYRSKGGGVWQTDCGSGCVDGGRPIHRRVCGHAARQDGGTSGADGKAVEIHAKVVSVTQVTHDGSAMIDRVTIQRRDGSGQDVDIQYDGGSMGSFLMPAPENEQYRTNVQLESIRVVFADNSSTYLKAPFLYQVPVITQRGILEYLECVELTVFPPTPIQAYKMPRRLADIGEGRLTKCGRRPKILLGTNHSDLFPLPAKHNGILPKGFRIWESLITGKWFLTGCPNYLPPPTITCMKITAKAWGAIERSFRRMVEAEEDEPHNPTQRRAMTADYAQDLLKQSLTLMPDKTKWEVRYHYDAGKLARLQPNKAVVLRRMTNQLRRVSQDKEIAEHLNKATAKNIERKVWLPIEEADFPPGMQAHYLPIGYHANENSTSTPYRIITDSSCKDAGGLSLNECQLRGTNKIGNLRDILMRFRLAPYAAVGDISAFYHCYELCRPDQSLRRIFVPEDWADQNSALKEFFEFSMPFGDANAGALAVLGRIKNAEMHADTLPDHLRERVVGIYSNATYIDDVVAYGNTMEDLDETVAAIESIARHASYAFKEWIRSGDANPTKVLGYRWDPESESIAVKSQFNIGRKIRGKKVDENLSADNVSSVFEGKLTKRNAVSLNGQLYDPLQLFGPLAIKLRIATSRINMAVGHEDWSATVPDELKEELRLALVEAMKTVSYDVPRRLHPVDAADRRGSMVIFCDGSLSAFGAAAYWRPGPLDAPSAGQLIASSAGTCLRKKVTAPRSELMGAVKAAQLYTSYINTISEYLQPENIFFFSDSEVVLNQLKLHSGSFNLFTGTRLQQIKDATPADAWYHIPGEWNPADLLTRDTAMFEDVTSEFWLNGSFIRRPVDEWPHRPVSKSVDEVPDIEVRGRVALIQAAADGCVFDRVLRKYGYLKKAVYAVMCALNFIRRAKGRAADATYDEALHFLLQRDPMQTRAPPKLTGFHTLVRDGVLVVRSRVFENQPVCYLPVLRSETPLGQLVLRDAHNRFGHGRSDRYVASILIGKFFVIAARRELRKLRVHCPTCRRLDPVACQTDIAPLPSSRTEPSRPFTHLVGDVFGPISVYSEVSRRTQLKVWVLLVICQFSRAIRLYLLRDYSTDALILALTEHHSHHGAFRSFWSDCGTNLKGASRVLKESNPTPFENAARLQRAFPEVKWAYGPPASPWCQGAAEVMIREVKKSLRTLEAVEGCSRLTMMDLGHLLHKVTITLNDRPLVLGPEIGDALTPSMLTYGTQLKIPEIDLTSTLTQRSRWVQKAFEEWWGRFCQSADLRRSYKFADKSDELQVGDIVLLLDQPSPNKWYRMGRVDAILNERRAIVEVVAGQSKKKLERHVRTLCKLADSA